MTLGLQPVARSSLSDAVFEQLCAQILARRVGPGEPLPSERDLSKALGVNRGAIREGLKRLAQAGLIEQRHGGGTLVLDFRRTASLDLLSRLLYQADGSPNLEVARSIMEMRAALAPDVARLCAERADDRVVDELAAVAEQMREVLDTSPTRVGPDGPTKSIWLSGDSEQVATQMAVLEQLQLLSLEFWDLLVTGSDNIAYRLAFNTLRQSYEQIREALLIPLAEELRSVDECRRLVAAVRAGDSRTARAAAETIVGRGTEGVLTGLELLDQLGAREPESDPDTGDAR